MLKQTSTVSLTPWELTESEDEAKEVYDRVLKMEEDGEILAQTQGPEVYRMLGEEAKEVCRRNVISIANLLPFRN